MRGIIAVTTDFGNKDHYNGVIKGVILSINPEVTIVDLASDADSFSVTDAAFLLYASASYFPRETVFLTVVDPGVGTKRGAVAVQCSNHFFVGPDNGVLYPAASQEGIIRAVRLENSRGTFDGRDIFAPAAARISLAKSINGLGEDCQLTEKFEFGDAVIDDGVINSKIIHVDKFGDAVTNIKSKQLEGVNSIKYMGKIIPRAVAFSACKGICFIDGSSGFIEIVADRHNASDELNLSAGKNLRLVLQ
ncbi:MAG: SAM-dependent chlorinase/fluorinase [Nitrososphaerota archaeon]|jgi:S-adenosylmethionine hydrolase|nr:SAM-dependent chlorinase/fluorinase [Nitrososphaerota archaeon]MDG6926903.1 SAM-dependent chlorinase/fluorinase [Nitrososphaerota archaeon]MDG6929979.1 SAM-dependent chlorinase/fluorinase [Nitrososphaerota archaeon]MDG6931930.1 SAM-dependent chlorinase/fluorinase [Nitrososphaerota archaeon]MDG6943867.1 SAM-dependent chlorinase/fluorinase [Nitrososphaerota archaeon]